MSAVTLKWRGDNLGLGSDHVDVHVIDAGIDRDISLEEALRRIDEFNECGRCRILAVLPFQFELGA